MAKRVTPYDYFTKFFPGGAKAEPKEAKKEANPAEKQPQQAPEPKIIYVDKPYPVQVPAKPTEMGNPNTNTNHIPWGLITIVSVVGIISLSIVAIVVGGKKS